jgi:hypothetical protein
VYAAGVAAAGAPSGSTPAATPAPGTNPLAAASPVRAVVPMGRLGGAGTGGSLPGGSVTGGGGRVGAAGAGGGSFTDSARPTAGVSLSTDQPTAGLTVAPTPAGSGVDQSLPGGFMPPMAMGMAGAMDGMHSGGRAPAWLVETEDVWGESTAVTPPVIGDVPPAPHPPVDGHWT